jgi:hypothetical protein
MRSYPLAYSVIVLPFSIVRWNGFKTGYASPASELSTKALWGLSGVFDAMLFFLTRPNILRFDDPPEIQPPTFEGEEHSTTSGTEQVLSGANAGYVA